ncbi:hypothetical protein BDR05DRAFT_1005897 [Suillus weaverae]|nr:hypothetical protein BDR05DRAFT_1005897 [Suillus weaverae]
MLSSLALHSLQLAYATHIQILICDTPPDILTQARVRILPKHACAVRARYCTPKFTPRYHLLHARISPSHRTAHSLLSLQSHATRRPAGYRRPPEPAIPIEPRPPPPRDRHPFPATSPLPSNRIRGESAPYPSLPSGNAFFNPTRFSSGRGKQKARAPRRKPIKVVDVSLGQATYADAFGDDDEEENIPVAVPPPRAQRTEVELKPMANQSQPEAEPSRLAATNNGTRPMILQTLFVDQDADTIFAVNKPTRNPEPLLRTPPHSADHSKEPCLEDLYICSYTPTLSALVRSRQLMKKRVPPSFVAIGQGQPGAGKGKALLAVDSELELAHKLVPAAANCTAISGDAAARAGALQALEENTWDITLSQSSANSFIASRQHVCVVLATSSSVPHLFIPSPPTPVMRRGWHVKRQKYAVSRMVLATNDHGRGGQELGRT